MPITIYKIWKDVQINKKRYWDDFNDDNMQKLIKENNRNELVYLKSDMDKLKEELKEELKAYIHCENKYKDTIKSTDIIIDTVFNRLNFN